MWEKRENVTQVDVLEKVAFHVTNVRRHGHREEGSPKEGQSQPWRSCKGDAHAVLEHAPRRRNATPGGRSDEEGWLKSEARRVGKKCRAIRKVKAQTLGKNSWKKGW